MPLPTLLKKINQGNITTVSLATITSPTDAQLQDFYTTYQLDVAPYTRFRSDGSKFVPEGGYGQYSIPPLSRWNGQYVNDIIVSLYSCFSQSQQSDIVGWVPGINHGETLPGAFVSGVLLPNGLVFLAPAATSLYAGLFNPETNEYFRAGGGVIPVSSANGGAYNKTGVVTGWNNGAGTSVYVPPSATYRGGCVVCLPYNAAAVPTAATDGVALIFNIATNTFVLGTNIINTSAQQSSGACVLPNGTVCVAPFLTNGAIKIYNPETDAVTSVTATGHSGTECAILCPNGKVFMGAKSTGGKHLLYDYNTGTVSLAANGENSSVGTQGLIMTKDGKIVMVPTSNNGRVQVYNPFTNTIFQGAVCSPGSGSVSLSGGCRLADGRIFMGQRATLNSVIYDPVADTCTNVPGNPVALTARYIGCVMAFNGKIVHIPCAGATIDMTITSGESLNDRYNRVHPICNRY